MHELVQQFGLSWPKFLAQIIIFGAVYFVLNRFAFGPVMAMLEARRKRIADGEAKLEKIARDLARADLKFKVGEYFVFIFAAIFAVGLLAYFIGNRSIISAAIGAIIGGIAPGFYVSTQQKRRLQKFQDQLADMLNLMVNGLRAGYSTMQAIEAVSK